MSSSRSRIDNIQRILQQWLAARGMDEKFGRYRVWQFWEAAVGPQIAARARPVRLRGAILEVQVDHPVWMQQLQLLKPRLLERLNEKLDGRKIEDLFLRYGRSAASRTQDEPDPLPRDWQDNPLSEEENRHIDETVAALPDGDLRRHMRHLLQMQVRLDKARRSKAGNKR